MHKEKVMKINIVSGDKRYVALCQALSEQGYEACITTYDKVSFCDYLILPIRQELSKAETEEAIIKSGDSSVILTGQKNDIDKRHYQRVIDYSLDEGLIIENAKLTAEATVSYIHSLTRESLAYKRVLVTGYGRIAKHLCPILKSLRATVYVYARREEVREQIKSDGFIAEDISFSRESDIIINTVPARIFSREAIEQIPQGAYIIELASSPYGFEKMDRVSLASGLPGKILTGSASKILLDTVISILSKKETEDIDI